MQFSLSKGSVTQWFCLALLSTLAVIPYLHGVGLNIVTLTYAQAAQRLWAGVSPYRAPTGIADWYKYSPFFAMIYYPLSRLPAFAHAILWAAFNATVFWIGMSEWVRVGRRTSWLLWLAVIGASMELDGSLRYQQVNAALVGATCLALGLYRRKAEISAGVVLALAAEVKLLPILFVATLAWPVRPRFFWGLTLGFGLTLLAPVVVFGLERAWSLHLQWAMVVMRDLRSPGLLDLESVLKAYHLPLARQMRLAVLCVSLLTLVSLRDAKVDLGPFFLLRRQIRGIFARFSAEEALTYQTGTPAAPSSEKRPNLLPALPSHYEKKGQSRPEGEIRNWPSWGALGLTCLLLASPRTESPTFVFLGAAYVLSALAVVPLSKRSGVKVLAALVWCAALFCGSLLYNDVWPRAWHPHHFCFKTWGTLLLWGLSLATLLLGRENKTVKSLTPRQFVASPASA